MGEGSGRESEKFARAVAIDLTRGAVDPRMLAAWRTWLAALATDAEAALAAAMAYESLEADARIAWLDALDEDADAIGAPKIALYAPLLAVETDEARKARILLAMGEGRSHEGTRALRGTTPRGDRVCAIATPLYLDFVELLACRYRPDDGVLAACHEPLRHASEIARAVIGVSDAAVILEPAPLGDVVEELAHAVVADRRAGRSSPSELTRFAHLFAPDLAAAPASPQSR